MWLARLFGGRKVTEDDEPARFTGPAPVPSVQPGKRSTSTGGPAAAKAPVKSGFDPYNSGSFERGTAWERVVRR